MKDKTLVLILPVLSCGGVANMVFELCRAIRDSHYRVYVICYAEQSDCALKQQLETVAECIQLDCAGKITPAKVYTVCRAISRCKPDVVHAHMGGMVYAAIWTMLHRVPLAVTIHTRPEKSFRPVMEKLLRLRFALGRCRMVAVSAKNKKLVDEYFSYQKDCVCINNGIDFARFYRVAHEHYTYINVSRQDENKNQALLIRVFARIYRQDAGCRLLLVGDGETHDRLKELCRELKIEEAVSFPGNVSDVEKYYARADAYVQTSHREALPMSFLEAMAAGLPLISTDVGGVRDVVQDNGILVPDGDEEALYRAMKIVKEQDTAATARMEQAALRVVQPYAASYMGQRYVALYDALCGAKTAGPEEEKTIR